MSAFLCDDAHISALAAYAASTDRLGCRIFPGPAIACAVLLREENERSMRARYGEEDYSPFEFNAYAASHVRQAPAIAIIKAAHCYAYQACEHDGWKDSDAKVVIDAIVARAVTEIPGYENAPWGSPV